jgi:micrococcal nuclease
MYTYKAAVVRIVDGDTIIVDIDLGFEVWLREQSIRMAKINAPEIRGVSREKGLGSKKFLEHIILNKWVTIKTEKDRKGKYGRWIATVLLEEDNNLININAKMVAEGFASKYDK